MSRINDLIGTLAPHGVPFYPVKRMTSIVPTGRGVKRQDYSVGSQIPIVDQGQRQIAGYTDDLSVAVPADDYVVFGDHTRAIKWVDFQFAPGADGTKVLKASPGILPRFLYFAMSNLDIPSRGYNRHWNVVRELRLPVPPLEVQREIVRILDEFTQLEAELEAELECRRRQYSFYRDQLLSFEGSLEVSRIPMRQVGEFIRGRRFVKADLVADGIASIHYGEIYTHYGTSATAVRSHVRRELAADLRYAKPGDVVIASVGETVKDVAKAVAWLGDTEVAIHDDSLAFRSDVDPTYIAYVMQTADFHTQKSQYVARGKVKRVGGEDLGKIVIPVPPREDQRRIVAILEKFDALVSDPSQGILAEIRARRRQYEYYRDKLLTLREAAA